MEGGSRIENIDVVETLQYVQHPFKRLSRVVILCCIVVHALSSVTDKIPTASAFVPHSHHFVSTERISTSPIKTIPQLSNPTSKSSTTITKTSLFGIKGFRAWFQDQFPNAVSIVDVSEHPDTFDHVLIDMNQILHTVLRRSRNTEQATKLLMIELDILVQRCKPSLSLVLAVDGSAAAAKLATQRKRRYSILKNTKFKLKHSAKLRMNKHKRAKRLRNYKAELRSLQLTPGTQCMQTLESAILYWAWQRLQNLGKPYSKLLPNVRIYISSSQVPGEGEIKLLEWINNYRSLLSKKPGQSIALVGGDADLLLEAMVIPPSWTHNVFVLRPEEAMNPNTGMPKKKNSSSKPGKGKPRRSAFNSWSRKNTLHCVSLWEMTLSLDEYCRRNLPKELYNPEERPADQNLLLQIRSDMVLLFMLNGNDYLPRVVAVGFRDVLTTYLLLLENWARRTESIQDIGLVEPNTLNFRSDFCADFFSILGKKAPSDRERMKNVNKSTKKTYQSILNDMSAIGFLPTPVQFDIFDKSQIDVEGLELQDQEMEAEDDLYEDEEDIDFDEDGEVDDDNISIEDEDEDEDDVDDDDDDENLEAYKDAPEVHIMQLSLGNKQKGDYHEYRVRVNSTSTSSFQRAKGKLSKMALEEFELLENVDGTSFDASKDYEWEIEVPAKASVERYLAGLVWTLQSYQEGVVPSYLYNYGKCLAPSGREIATYFVTAMNENRDVGAAELLADFEPGGSVCAGVACLAALPISVKKLVPKPYSLLDDEVIEGIYSDCMNSTDNFFHLKKFETLVDNAVERLLGGDRNTGDSKEFTTRDIVLGDHYWTVLKRTPQAVPNPFKPPRPPAENFVNLRSNNRIKVSRIICMDMPLPRTPLNDTMADSLSQKSNYPRKFWDQNNIMIDHLSFGSMINGSESSILETPYKIAFRNSPKTYGGSQSPTKQSSFELLKSEDVRDDINLFKLLKADQFNNVDLDNDDLEQFATTTPENLSAILTLKQLVDIQMLGSVDFYKSDGEYILALSFDTIPLEDISFSFLLYPKARMKLVKQYLASQALDAMMNPGKSKNFGESEPIEQSETRWYDMTFDDLKEFLMVQYPVTRDATVVHVNPDNQNSVVFFNQLRDIGIVKSWEFIETPASTGKPEKIAFSFRSRLMQAETIVYERHKNTRTKKWIKQHLMSMALDMLLTELAVGEDNDSTTTHWYDLSFKDFKDRISVRSRRAKR